MRSYNSKLFQMQKTYGESANILPKDVKFVHQFFVSRKKATTDVFIGLGDNKYNNKTLRSNLVYKALFKEKYVIGTAFETGIQNEI